MALMSIKKIASRLTLSSTILSRQYWDPGRLYNLGNLVGFFGGAGATIATARSDASGLSALGRLEIYAFGNTSALMLSLATLIFFVAGLAYTRAWRDGAVPDRTMSQVGDGLSGVAAIAFGAGVALLGNSILAASGGAMHAIGKFGSACSGESKSAGMPRLGSFFKELVLLSRIPAICAAAAGVFRAEHGTVVQIILSLNVIFCCLVWAAADIRLLPANAAVTRMISSIVAGRR
ncbi:hypothetical protein DTW90_33700 [Neorhizobium sp. P12A]|uniref:hypothetical protein n=1 Tax=Neorhizobium sp. P12A TaxID=2268027 RepID=UPI0011ED4AD1|nr:hypothetical protein [Neorhizobium sp. P12A]KAA0686881.1 hypothetical protein DTW90_33700 [Neorhizobium sp. P12A]